MTIFEYIKKYGQITFEEKQINEIDNLVFSILAYLDFSDILKENSNTLEEVGEKFISRYTLKEISAYGIPQKDAYNCLKAIKNTARYKDVQILDYIYVGTTKEQFCAMTFRITDKLSYIAFEGSDYHMSGWKENFQLSYMYPIPSQIHAMNYLNNHIKILGPKIIVGGHSKGGNLALTAAMEMKKLKKNKIIKIYNNDGPGLRLKEFNSKKYRQIKNKIEHIIPYNSFIGILLRNDTYKVVDSNRKTVLSHYPISWLIQEDELKEADLKERSKELEKSMIEWLNNHDDVERKKMIENVFNIFEKCEITDTRKLKKIKYLLKVFKEVKNIDEETKQLVISFISYNFF